MAMVDDAKIRSATPAAVVEMARVLPIGRDVAERLLSDDRMVGVWRELGRREPLPLAVNDRYLLNHWDIDDRHVSPQDRACAALFAFVVIEFAQKRTIITSAHAQASVAMWGDVVKCCRSVPEHDTANNADLARSLAVVAKYFEDRASVFDPKSPYFLSRSARERSDDETRARVRALGRMMHKIYGSFLYGTLATMATVALGLEDEIARKSAENWCSDLLAGEDHSAAAR